MKNAFNGDLENLIMAGYPVVCSGASSSNIKKGVYTHILLQVPKKTTIGRHKNGMKYIIVAWAANWKFPQWYESVYYYSTKNHAIRGFYNRITEG